MLTFSLKSYTSGSLKAVLLSAVCWDDAELSAAGSSFLVQPESMVTIITRASRNIPGFFICFFSLFVMIRDLFQEVDDRQVLRAHALALAAFDTFAGLAELIAKQLVIREIDRPAFFLQVFPHVFIIY